MAGERLPATATSSDLAAMSIRLAAKGHKVMLVLDDVWHASHERPLNCLDPDNGASRLL